MNPQSVIANFKVGATTALRITGSVLFTNQTINHLTPNDPYRGRTAPLTSKFAFYIFIQQI